MFGPDNPPACKFGYTTNIIPAISRKNMFHITRVRAFGVPPAEYPPGRSACHSGPLHDEALAKHVRSHRCAECCLVPGIRNPENYVRTAHPSTARVSWDQLCWGMGLACFRACDLAQECKLGTCLLSVHTDRGKDPSLTTCCLRAHSQGGGGQVMWVTPRIHTKCWPLSGPPLPPASTLLCWPKN